MATARIDERKEVYLEVQSFRVGLQSSAERLHECAGARAETERRSRGRSESWSELLDYTLHTNQLGQSGSIRVADGRLLFRKLSAGEEQTASEELEGPVAVGPTLVGFVMRNLRALRAGTTVAIRLALPDRLETIGFELKSVASKPNETRIEMSPSSFLIGLAVEPIYFTFDATNDKLQRLEGRVPPKVQEGNEWKDLEARVEYEFVAKAYL